MPFTIADFFNSGIVLKYFTDNMLILSLAIIAVIICSYLLGSVNFAIIISGKKYKQDIRQYGSKNAGMTNMMRTYGKKAAGLTLLGDALKAVFACLIGYTCLGALGAYIAGLFCILGHVFPIFYRFKGGKGVVTAAVAVLMCNPIVFLVLFIIFALIVIFTKYISLGSVMCMLLFPIVLDRITVWVTGSTSPFIIFAVLMTVVIVLKHSSNIKRLLSGTESKFSFKKSVKAPEEATEAKKDTEEK